VNAAARTAEGRPLGGGLRVIGSPATLRRLALASVIANVGIVVTGGAVRLTGSGLGCPTWPHCDGNSYVTTPAQGYHGVIEFTNRTLTFIVTVLAALCLIAAWAQARDAIGRRARIGWALGVLASIPAQAVLGGLTVLSKLNPWLVACHFLLSIAIIAAAYQLWIRCRPERFEAPERPAIALRALAWAIVGVTAVVIAAGTVTTGSGPHAGDEHAKRTGLNPENVAQLHADLVMLLIGLSVAAWFALRVTGASRGARAAALLVVVECAQAAIGFVQYFTNLPIVLVGAHMLGACTVWLAALWLLTASKPSTQPVKVEVPAARAPEQVGA
jgi:cytochrome c oxidase assembly protein subunit 15